MDEPTETTEPETTETPAPPPAPPKLSDVKASVGRILLYTFAEHELGYDDRSLGGTVRPALVVRDNGGSYNCQVFMDGSNDGCANPAAGLWVTSRVIAEESTPGFLHWPPRV